MFYPGETYEIERDGSLAKLKTPMGAYVFEFDRASPLDNTRDYTCDKCGHPCKTLNELGNHVYSTHPEGRAEEEEDEGEVFADRTCTLCDPPRVCKSPYGLRVHQDRAHNIPRKDVVEVQDGVTI